VKNEGSASEEELRHRQRRPNLKRKRDEDGCHEDLEGEICEEDSKEDSEDSDDSDDSEDFDDRPFTKAQLPKKNKDVGDLVTNLLNGKDSRIADLEEEVAYFEQFANEDVGEFLFLSEEMVVLQQDLAGIKRKYPYPTFKLGGIWNKLKDTVTSKLNEAAAEQSSKDAKILALERQLAQQKSDAEHNLAQQNLKIQDLNAKLEGEAGLRSELAASQAEVRKQAVEILQLQARTPRADTEEREVSTELRASELTRKTESVCPPGLRTPSASDILRRLEAEGMCERLKMELGSLYQSISGLKEMYENNVDAEASTTTEDWSDFKEELDEIQRKADETSRVNSRTVYDEAMGRTEMLVVDLHQMERKERSAQNDINKILNLIEQHERKCEGAPVFGKHTAYPDFLPKKDATLRGGQ